MIRRVSAGALVFILFSAHAIGKRFVQLSEPEPAVQAHAALRPIPYSTITTYADATLEVKVNEHCQVQKVNGVPPLQITHVEKGLDNVVTRTGITLTIQRLDAPLTSTSSMLHQFYRCDITWTDEQGQTGVLQEVKK